MADHVWGGGYEKDGRIGDFPHDPQRPVYTSWDLGVDDYTAIWFFQHDGKSPTVIDYYEG